MMNENTYVADSRRTIRSGCTRLTVTLNLALAITLLAVAQVGATLYSDPPSPRFDYPTNGSTVEGIVMVSVYAPELLQYQAELGVDSGSWQVMKGRGDGVFQMLWNSAYVHNGKHSLTARFSMGLGRPPVYAISVLVNVENIEIEPPPPISQAGILSNPCIHEMPAYGLMPNHCYPPVTN
jgi:hypothetical protein